MLRRRMRGKVAPYRSRLCSFTASRSRLPPGIKLPCRFLARAWSALLSSLRGMGRAPVPLAATPRSALTSSTCASRRERSLLFVGLLRATQVWRPFWLGTPWAGAWRFRRRALLRMTCGMAAISTALRSEAPQPSLRAVEIAAWMRSRATCGTAISSVAFRSEAPQPSLHAIELIAWT